MVNVLRAITHQEIELVNPNPEIPYTDHAPGIGTFEFQPLERVFVEKRVAMALLARVPENMAHKAMQHNAEKNDYTRLMGTDNEGMKLVAQRFVDEKGQPKTKLWPRPPLVRMDSDEGRKHYMDACAEAKKKGIKIPDEGEDIRPGIAMAEVPAPPDSTDKAVYMHYIEERGGSASTAEQIEKLREKAAKLYKAQCDMLRKAGVTPVTPGAQKVPGPEPIG